jgi:hypothetical protein
VHAKVGIGYHGVTSSIPPSDLPAVSVVGEGEVTISIKHWQGYVWKQPLGYTCPLQKGKDCTQSQLKFGEFNRCYIAEVLCSSMRLCVRMRLLHILAHTKLTPICPRDWHELRLLFEDGLCSLKTQTQKPGRKAPRECKAQHFSRSRFGPLIYSADAFAVTSRSLAFHIDQKISYWHSYLLIMLIDISKA